ncbi:intradiol ring-cleavage dioxygenase [Altererythrobacter salegens]|uniref:Intradiol ring-cleavage dioxygenase n=1 Tax=Croceibacterium salegens TaxID=1737568 RepID=A0A6I4STZ5_9SPHN|nr:intradiol ring-cleavage dioxygenase [Croceibacterium salegens]MXO59395.1 intradiol ring-cleavage dioxygenase [Croceibacterium salegens]
MADAPGQLSLDRRATLALLGLGGAALAGCGSGARAAACLATPAETRGPFAGDGGSDRGGRRHSVLTGDEVIRSDIRDSFAGLEGTAEGVPLDLTITLLGTAGGCNAMAGWGLYLWHNDAAGKYSLYDLPRANYLRGLQQSGDEGTLRFSTILPGCYGGRAPHLHFEVYSSAQAALSGEPAVLASQFALPEDACRAVYSGDRRYGDSLANLDRWPTRRDFVFSDASEEELALESIALEGDAGRGFKGKATVAIRY